MPGGHGWDAGLRTGDRVVEILDPPGAPLDDPRRLVVEKDGSLRTVAAVSPRISNESTRWSLPLIGFFYVSLGSLVLLRRSELRAARSFWFFCVMVGLATAVTPASGGPGPGWAVITQVLALIVSFWALGRFFSDLASTRGKLVDRALKYAPVAVAALAAVYLTIYHIQPNAYSTVLGLIVAFFAMSVAVSIRAIGDAYRSSQSPNEKAIAAIMVSSIALGLLPLIVLFALPVVAGIDEIVSADIAGLASVAIPVGFVYATYQHEMLGIRRLVQRGAVYVALSVLLLGAIALTLAGISELSPDLFGENSSALLVAAGAAVVGAIAFSVLRPLAQRLADRYIYRDLFDYREAVSGLAREAQLPTDPRELAANMLNRVVSLIGIEGFAIVADSDRTPSVLLSGGPSAEKLRRAAETRRLPDADGSTIHQLDGEPVLALRLEGKMSLWLGPKLGGDSFRDDDLKLAEPLGTLVGMLLTRFQLTVELQDLNTRLVTAEEEERARLAREIHDGPLQQALYLVITSGSDTKMTEQARALAADLRTITTSLRPPLLEDLGLKYAIDWLARSYEDQHAIVIQFDEDSFPEEARLPEEIELALYRCIQEALNNVVKHAQAGRVRIRLEVSDHRVTASVQDDGVGMSEGDRAEAARAGHLGLVGMRERIRGVGGTLRVEGQAGLGTTVIVEAPTSVEQDRASRREDSVSS